MVGQGQGVHPQLFGPLQQPLQTARPVQEAVMAVAMEMDEGGADMGPFRGPMGLGDEATG